MLKVISFLLLCLVLQTPAQANSCATLESLAWLVGQWHSKNSKFNINESWQQISNKTFEGSGYTYSIKNNKMVSAETLRLVAMSGEVFYIAKVASNNLPVAFKLTSCTANTAIFENPQHDFPKKISYQMNKDKSMTVVVSGEKDNAFSIQFVAKSDN